MEKLFSDIFNDNYSYFNTLKLDKKFDTDLNCIVYFDVPGYTKDDISVEVKDQIVYIKGKEIFRGYTKKKFEYNFVLDKNYIVGNAYIKNGILSIEFNRIKLLNNSFSLKIDVKEG